MKISVHDYFKDKTFLYQSFYVREDGHILDKSSDRSDKFVNKIVDVHNKVGINCTLEAIIEPDGHTYGTYSVTTDGGICYVIPNDYVVQDKMMKALEDVIVEF